MARILIILGVLLVAVGLLLRYAPAVFSWFGRLPGDITFRTERTTVFIPVTSMIIVSALLTLLLHFLRK